MIQLTHVSKIFDNGKNAVDDISFEVQAGEILVLLGTSGCGKTTTLRMINRLLEPSAGNIFIDGADTSTIPPTTLRKGMGYVMQNNGLFPHYTVLENISTVPQLLGWDDDKTRERCISLMHKLKLNPDTYADVYPAQLSGGQQQRVGLARALAADPPVLLMDEPFGALDPLTRSGVRKEFKTLDELHKKTVVLVTHDIEEALELGHRICLMNEGRIQQIGSPIELLFRPHNDFVRNFFDGQRLQLELSVLHLQDIWQFIPLTDIPDSYREVPASTNCWEALSLLGKGNVVARSGTLSKPITASSIMDGLHSFKKH
ncbi:ABC transporter ATP-binding protein [Chitinophaga sp. Cy-1792]|uniref:ABC transporter ATP-binding protein n=1 Tax=Chitinophaga sp. Cy-1792 TaxID=2608339 RepID=UPI00141FB0DE|nr:ATP-binding cassette domain-containing protein [Chitinophaga sp. Cy-1792]NIG54358.1 ATP-binding cassette domain-containing protein [Chitinophaga sp. Cy-1792]